MIRYAIDFATKKHKGQVRKGNGESYINHAARVASRILINDPYIDERVIAAGWLHDTLEDSDTYYYELVCGFGDIVANFVQGMTNPSHNDEHKDKSPSERKTIDLEYMCEQHDCVKLIKLADRIDNLWDFYKAGDRFMYKYGDETKRLLEKALRGTNYVFELELRNIIDLINRRAA